MSDKLNQGDTHQKAKNRGSEYLCSHIRNFIFAWFNLSLEFLNFVVKNKLELFKFLIFLFQVVDALVLLIYGNISISNL
jgi:hypothetical protein